MKCAWVQKRLLLYMASELESWESIRVSRHLRTCPHCAAASVELAETLERVEAALPTSVTAPPDLDARIMESVRQLSPQRTPRPTLMRLWSRRRLVGAAAALCLLIAVYLAGGPAALRLGVRPVDPSRTAVPEGLRPKRPVLALALLGDDHLKYLANPQPAQIPGPDPRTVSSGLTPLIRFPVAAIDLRPEGARLLGGRKCHVHGQSIAFLLYDWKGERVSLYQIDGRKIALPPLREVAFRGRRFHVDEAGGLSYVAWRSGAMNFVMVSGAKREHLLRLARCASGMPDHAIGASSTAGALAQRVVIPSVVPC